MEFRKCLGDSGQYFTAWKMLASQKINAALILFPSGCSCLFGISQVWSAGSFADYPQGEGIHNNQFLFRKLLVDWNHKLSQIGRGPMRITESNTLLLEAICKTEPHVQEHGPATLWTLTGKLSEKSPSTDPKPWRAWHGMTVKLQIPSETQTQFNSINRAFLEIASKHSRCYCSSSQWRLSAVTRELPGSGGEGCYFCRDAQGTQPPRERGRRCPGCWTGLRAPPAAAGEALPGGMGGTLPGEKGVVHSLWLLFRTRREISCFYPRTVLGY